MDAERYARVKEVFLEASALNDPERSAFLAYVCAEDAALLDEVRSLLDHTSDVSLIETADPTPEPAKKGFGEALKPGMVISDYVIEEQIGAGAFGAVYRGVHRVIEKRAAIKVLSQHYSSDPQIVSRFVSEARAVNKIGHSGIIDIFAFGQLDDGRHYHIMELVDGPTLAELLRDAGKFDVVEALELLRPVARALDAAAAAGIAHRDLKPHNILVATDDLGHRTPKLLDFGVAKLLDDDDSRLHHTDTGVTMGTPSYMAPEQCTGAAVDHRADIYAFGAVIFQMLTGQLPFPAPNAFMAMARHVNDRPPSPHEVEPSVSPAVGRVVQWMMAKDPAKRPASVGAALDALEAASRGNPVDVPLVFADEASGVAGAEEITKDLRPPPRPVEVEEAPTSAPRRPVVALAFGAVAVVVVGLFATGVIGPGSEADSGAVAANARSGDEEAGALGADANDDAANGEGGANGALGPGATARASDEAKAARGDGEGGANGADRASDEAKAARGDGEGGTSGALGESRDRDRATVELGEEAANAAGARGGAPGTKKPAPARSPVRVELRGLPDDARVEFDGELLRRGPGAVELARGRRAVTLRVVAKGFQARSLRVVPDRDRVVTPRLEPVKAPRGAPDLNDLEPWDTAGGP